MRASGPLSLKARMAFADRLRGAPEATGYLRRETLRGRSPEGSGSGASRRHLWSAARLPAVRAPFSTVPEQRLEAS